MQEIQRILDATNSAFAEFTETDDNEYIRRRVANCVASVIGDLTRLNWIADNLDQEGN